VQKDCGYIPLVTPTSQIVGTQAVFNVLFGRYKNLTAETADLVTGRYGALAAPAHPDLVKLALEKNKYEAVLTERPADKIPNEFSKIETEAKAAGAVSVEDVLTYAMFPKVAPDFFKNKSTGPVDSASFVVKPAAPSGGSSTTGGGGGSGGGGAGTAASYVVNVNGADYNVSVRPSGTIAVAAGGAAAPIVTGGVNIPAPVAGTVLKHVAAEGAQVKRGETVIVIESMKMELEVKSTDDGKIHFLVPVGTAVQAQQPIAALGGVVQAAPAQAAPAASQPSGGGASGGGAAVPAPVAGTVLKHAVAEGSRVNSGDTIIIIESMKMELEIKATSGGAVHFLVPTGTAVQAQQPVAEIR
jgi:oxaloacetate decarboxylase alpha subunit